MDPTPEQVAALARDTLDLPNDTAWLILQGRLAELGFKRFGAVSRPIWDERKRLLAERKASKRG